MLISAGGMLPWCDVSTTAAGLTSGRMKFMAVPKPGSSPGAIASRITSLAAFPGVIFHQEDDACRVTSPLIHEAEGLQLDDILHFDSEGLFSIAGRRGRVVKIEENASRLTRSNVACWSSTAFAKRRRCRSRAEAVRGLAPCWFWMKRPVSAVYAG
jgi:hypothetical protein